MCRVKWDLTPNDFEHLVHGKGFCWSDCLPPRPLLDNFVFGTAFCNCHESSVSFQWTWKIKTVNFYWAISVQTPIPPKNKYCTNSNIKREKNQEECRTPYPIYWTCVETWENPFAISENKQWSLWTYLLYPQTDSSIRSSNSDALPILLRISLHLPHHHALFSCDFYLYCSESAFICHITMHFFHVTFQSLFKGKSTAAKLTWKGTTNMLVQMFGELLPLNKAFATSDTIISKLLRVNLHVTWQRAARSKSLITSPAWKWPTDLLYFPRCQHLMPQNVLFVWTFTIEALLTLVTKITEFSRVKLHVT